MKNLSPDARGRAREEGDRAREETFQSGGHRSHATPKATCKSVVARGQSRLRANKSGRSAVLLSEEAGAWTPARRVGLLVALVAVVVSLVALAPILARIDYARLPTRAQWNTPSGNGKRGFGTLACRTWPPSIATDITLSSNAA